MSSGDKYSQVLSDIEQTFTLAGTIITLVKEPIALVWQNFEKRTAIQRSIGDWGKEAYNDGECHMPVLRYKSREPSGKAFETYLDESDGICAPDGKLPAKSCWAYLMHSFGVKPGLGLVQWASLEDGYVSTQNGGIEMEIDGAAFCSVVNLFYVDGIWDDSRTDFKAAGEINSVKLICGDLAWTERDSVIHAHFKPGTANEVNMEKIPFLAIGMRMETGTLMASYHNALEHGVSDTSLALLDHTASLKERLQRFDDAYWKIKGSPRPLLMTKGWLYTASRIVKKALANGGNDQSFFEDLCQALEPTLIPEQRSRDEWRDEVRADFLFGDEMPRFSTLPKLFTPPPPRSTALKELYERVLDVYKDQKNGSWKHELFLAKEEVSKLAGWSGIIWLPPFSGPSPLSSSLDEEGTAWNRRVLPFDQTSPLWNRKILLGSRVEDVTSTGP
jgi:hypothetical protein